MFDIGCVRKIMFLAFFFHELISACRMHVMPAKAKCNRLTDGLTTDKVISMLRFASLAPQKVYK